MRIRRVGVFSCAKIVGILYAVIGLFAGLFMAFFSMLGATFGETDMGQEGAIFGALFGIGGIIFMPIIYGVMGFIFTAIGAAIYNLLAGAVGGIEVDLEPMGPSGHAPLTGQSYPPPGLPSPPAGSGTPTSPPG